MRGPVERIAAFVEDLLHNRRPRRFKASPEDVAILRAAAELSAARPGANLPDREFIDQVCAYIKVTVHTQYRMLERTVEVRERMLP